MISHFTGKRKDTDKAELLILADIFIKELEELPWYNELASIDVDRCFTLTDSKRVKIIHEAIAEEIALRYNVISYHDVLYVYQDGYYQEGSRQIKSLAHKILKNVGDDGNLYKDSHETATREVIHRLRSEDPYFEYPFNDHGNIIPVLNGLVKIEYEQGTAELIPHSPYYRFNYKIPVVYDPDADSETVHNEVISQYIDGREVDVLYQIPAQALLQMMGAMPYKKAYLLQGDANAGKTSYLTLLSYLFGTKNLSNMSLQQLATDKFSTANLEGKIINTYDDLSDIPLNEGGIIKTITGTKYHWVQKKGVQAYEAIINAVHCYACNTAPNASKLHNDTAFWERWEFIYFSNLFDVDPYFYERVYTPENISGFFNRVLEAVITIRNNGLLWDSTASEVMEKWTYNADPLFRFLDDNMTESDRPMYFEKDEFLELYLTYCQKEDIQETKRPSTTSTLTKLLFKYGIPDKQMTAADGTRKRRYEVYRSWKPDSIYQNHIKRIVTKTEQSSIN